MKTRQRGQEFGPPFSATMHFVAASEYLNTHSISLNNDQKLKVALFASKDVTFEFRFSQHLPILSVIRSIQASYSRRLPIVETEPFRICCACKVGCLERSEGYASGAGKRKLRRLCGTTGCRLVPSGRIRIRSQGDDRGLAKKERKYAKIICLTVF